MHLRIINFMCVHGGWLDGRPFVPMVVCLVNASEHGAHSAAICHACHVLVYKLSALLFSPSALCCCRACSQRVLYSSA